MSTKRLTAIEAAELIKCSVSFIRKMKQQGKLPYVALGSRYTFDQNDVLNLVKKFEPHTNDNIELE